MYLKVSTFGDLAWGKNIQIITKPKAKDCTIFTMICQKDVSRIVKKIYTYIQVIIRRYLLNINN